MRWWPAVTPDGSQLVLRVDSDLCLYAVDPSVPATQPTATSSSTPTESATPTEWQPAWKVYLPCAGKSAARNQVPEATSDAAAGTVSELEAISPAILILAAI